MSRQCPLCGKMNVKRYGGMAGKELASCRECGGAFVDPLPSPGDVLPVLDEAASARLPREQTPVVIARLKERHAVILDYLQTRGCSGSLLDIGCGRGLVLADARERGWKVKGIEPARRTAEEGIRRRGLNIFIGTLAEAKLPPCSFNAVVMSHSIEHFVDPLEALRAAAGLLVPGGWLYIETPNWNSLTRRLLGRRWWAVDPDNHLHYFTPRSLESLCRKAGLSLRDGWGINVDPLAVLIRLGHARNPEYNDFAVINGCRDRLLAKRGMWRLSRLLEAAAHGMLQRSYLNDYLVFWLQKPPAGERAGD